MTDGELTVSQHRQPLAPAAYLAPEGARPRRLGRFLTAVIEGVAMLLALAVLEILFFGRGGYATFDLHPFWVPVLVVTVQYGFFAGVVTAAAAGFALDTPERPLGLDIVTYYAEAARQPLQWVGAAIMIGLYRQGQIRAEDRNVEEIGRLRAMNARFARTVAELDAELGRFETDIAIGAGAAPGAAAAGAQAALARLAELRTASVATIAERLAAAAEALAPGLAPTLMLRDPVGHLVEICGAASGGTPLRGFGFDHPVARRAERRGVAEGDGTVVVALRRGPGALIGLLVAKTQALDGDTGREALRLLADATVEALIAAAAESDHSYAKVGS